MKPLTLYRGYDNVLLGQGCRTPRGAVIDEYGAVVKWWLAGENRRTGSETCCSVTSSTTNITWRHSGLNPGLRRKKPVSNRLSIACRHFIRLRSKYSPTHAVLKQPQSVLWNTQKRSFAVAHVMYPSSIVCSIFMRFTSLFLLGHFRRVKRTLYSAPSACNLELFKQLIHRISSASLWSR
jgi:hypothetical protein